VDEHVTQSEPQPRPNRWQGFRAWLAQAFAIEAYAESSLSPQERAVLERMALQIHKRKLTSAAILWIESNRHMNWMGSQVLVMFQPIFDLAHPLLNAMLRNFGLNIPPADYPTLCAAFEKRYSIEYFVQRLEACAAGEYNDDPAKVSDKPA
jgi:hypothetical protein